MDQALLFPPPVAPEPPALVGIGERLRGYQVTAGANTLTAFEAVRSVLLVMATGCGKTVVFLWVAAKFPGNVLIVAHRKELIYQAAARAREFLHEEVGVEMGNERFQGSPRIIVASKDSLHQDRLDSLGRRWTPGLIIVDEAHHLSASNESYTRILDKFPEAKVLGVTATPDRADEARLGETFEDVAFVYEIDDAIRDGFLVPVRCKRVVVESVDLRAVKTVAGDYNQGQLDALMRQEEAIHRVVDSARAYGEGLKGPVFVTSIATAKLMAEVFNHYEPGSAASLDANTPAPERSRILRAYEAGDLRWLPQCNILTEGWDSASTTLMVNAAPTQSRARYAQRAGRVTRPLPGVVDGVASAWQRKSAIAASGKPFGLILDMVGTSLDHRLVGPEDVLGGKNAEEVVARAKAIAEKEGGGDVLDLLERAKVDVDAEARIALRAKAKITVTTKSQVIEVDPFAFYGIENAQEKWGGSSRFGWRPPTPKMKEAIEKFGMGVGEGLSFGEARVLLDTLIGNAKAGRATFKQARFLQSKGLDARDWSFEQASEALTTIKNQGWKTLSKRQVKMILNREPGAYDR